MQQEIVEIEESDCFRYIQFKSRRFKIPVPSRNIRLQPPARVRFYYNPFLYREHSHKSTIFHGAIDAKSRKCRRRCLLYFFFVSWSTIFTDHCFHFISDINSVRINTKLNARDSFCFYSRTSRLRCQRHFNIFFFFCIRRAVEVLIFATVPLPTVYTQIDLKY